MRAGCRPAGCDRSNWNCKDICVWRQYGKKAVGPYIKPRIGMGKEEYQNNQNSTSINHFYEKLLLLKDMMNTNTAKKLAEHRQAVMEGFLDEFMAEWEGETWTDFQKKIGNYSAAR